MQDINTHFDFTVVNGRVTVMNDFNSRINYLKADGDLAVIPTAINRIKYGFYQKTAPVRHYLGLGRLFRDFA